MLHVEIPLLRVSMLAVRQNRVEHLSGEIGIQIRIAPERERNAVGKRIAQNIERRPAAVDGTQKGAVPVTGGLDQILAPGDVRGQKEDAVTAAQDGLLHHVVCKTKARRELLVERIRPRTGWPI